MKNRALFCCLLAMLTLTAEIANAQGRSPVDAAQPFRVVDNNGEEVGLLSGPGTVIRLVNNVWTHIPVWAAGFVERGVQALYESNNCTGATYVNPALDVPRFAETFGGGGSTMLYLASDITSVRMIASAQQLRSSGAQPCSTFSPLPLEVAVPDTVTLTATPPFRVER